MPTVLTSAKYSIGDLVYFTGKFTVHISSDMEDDYLSVKNKAGKVANTDYDTEERLRYAISYDDYGTYTFYEEELEPLFSV